MDERAKPSKFLAGTLLGGLLCGLLFGLGSACAFAQTVRHHREVVETDSVTPEVKEAEAAIEKRDFAAAEKLLTPVVAANPKDDRAWYDLGFVYKATQRRPQAIDAYRKSIAAKPDLYEANLNLALLLAQDGQNADAAKYLQAAIKLTPTSTPAAQKAANWMDLGRIEEKTSPLEAAAAFRRAAELSPKDAEPHLMAARLLSNSKDVAGAEKEYKAALAINAHSKD